MFMGFFLPTPVPQVSCCLLSLRVSGRAGGCLHLLKHTTIIKINPKTRPFQASFPTGGDRVVITDALPLRLEIPLLGPYKTYYNSERRNLIIHFVNSICTKIG